MPKRKSNGVLRVYKSYNFVEKDPIIDAMRTAFSDSQQSYQEVSLSSGVSVTAIRGWFHGKTRSPQFQTSFAVVRALNKRGVRFANGRMQLID